MGKRSLPTRPQLYLSTYAVVLNHIDHWIMGVLSVDALFKDGEGNKKCSFSSDMYHLLEFLGGFVCVFFVCVCLSAFVIACTRVCVIASLYTIAQ